MSSSVNTVNTDKIENIYHFVIIRLNLTASAFTVVLVEYTRHRLEMIKLVYILKIKQNA